jgi:hypothetical protein
MSDYMVTNNSGSPVNSWSVTLGFNQSVTITNAWGIDIAGSGSSMTGGNVGYNGYIAPGQSVSFGMQGSSSTAISAPSCTVN